MGKCSGGSAWASEGKSWDWEKEEPPHVGEDQIQEHLRNVKVHKAIGLDEMHLWVLRELAEEATHWQEKGKCNPHFLKRKKKGNDRLVILTSVSWKIIEQTLLQTAKAHGKQEGVWSRKTRRWLIDHNQHGFTKGKLCLANLMSSYDRVITVDEARVTGITYLDFWKAFATVPENILVSKLERHGLDGWTTHG